MSTTTGQRNKVINVHRVTVRERLLAPEARVVTGVVPVSEQLCLREGLSGCTSDSYATPTLLFALLSHPGSISGP
ncbi:hypothetical protein ACIGPN_05855 [Streptomyces afghaniensis]|uniref:hypothetical protein n=1 Tax=Streptomyces afghaniensis TaxID=66865 RepID=UPI0037D5FB2C